MVDDKVKLHCKHYCAIEQMCYLRYYRPPIHLVLPVKYSKCTRVGSNNAEHKVMCLPMSNRNTYMYM